MGIYGLLFVRYRYYHPARGDPNKLRNSDSQSSRTLAVAAHFGEHVDDDNCVYQCIQLGYIFAGVEYSGQCCK
jgi:hypothetical protein